MPLNGKFMQNIQVMNIDSPWNLGVAPFSNIFKQSHQISWGLCVRCPECLRMFEGRCAWSAGDDPPGTVNQQVTGLAKNHIPVIPSGYVKIAIENGDLVRGFTHWKWWFSIVMLVYQRVFIDIHWPSVLGSFNHYDILWQTAKNVWAMTTMAQQLTKPSDRAPGRTATSSELSWSWRTGSTNWPPVGWKSMGKSHG